MAVRMELARILIRETSDSHMVELREAGGERVFKIVIGLIEAAAIERRLMGQQPPRPQTHELLANVIESLGGKVQRILINDLRHDEQGRGTFFARLLIEHQGRVVEVDSRPSDAIALGAASDVPIFVEEAVLDEVSQEP